MIQWRKSSYSGSTSTQSDCIEVADLGPEIGIRDSKAPGAGHLALSRQAFAGLLSLALRDESPHRGPSIALS
ncbi:MULTISPECIES: DUF397 domain-containing protein [Actinomadura]|uniref:DUF397 domain-containing protein n=1 Tax=Actinomadura geliboluensis TaxID=882440 RepID=A0A5S4GAY0_9ACTN|nr:DUF397 domain-containing protein [Actinomadura geliboluensis]TMR30103.1 DUF397 domain-containing protein [Actinomadura geliboluensis]